MEHGKTRGEKDELPTWFETSLLQLVAESDGIEAWPDTIWSYRHRNQFSSTVVPSARSPRPGGPNPTTYGEYWGAFKEILAGLIATGSMSASSFASLTGIIQYDAPAEMVDQQLRCLWYDLWGFEPIPGAIDEVPWFLPGYTKSPYICILTSQTIEGSPLSQDEQEWLDERRLVWMEAPAELAGRAGAHSFVDPEVLDEARARVSLGWLRKL